MNILLARNARQFSAEDRTREDRGLATADVVGRMKHLDVKAIGRRIRPNEGLLETNARLYTEVSERSRVDVVDPWKAADEAWSGGKQYRSEVFSVRRCFD